MKREHERIEAIAGAIALGEASDEERRRYREHIAGCRPCLQALGGEHEIARVAQHVAMARESEVWEPQIRDVVAARLARRTRAYRYAFGVSAAALTLALGMRVAFGGDRAHRPAPGTLAAASDRSAAAQPHRSQEAYAAPDQPRRLVVVHNVVQIARAPIAPPSEAMPQKAPARPPTIVSVVVHPAEPPARTRPAASDVPIWRRDVPSWRTVAKTTTTSVSESAPQTFAQSAESIRLVHPQVVREALPIGGETAITPQPPMIAYDENAEGTTVFEVLVDEQGNPTKCIITQSSNFQVLDDSVCKAAMRAKFSPKTIDGRAVTGIYHDAFTFRSGDDR